MNYTHMQLRMRHGQSLVWCVTKFLLLNVETAQKKKKLCGIIKGEGVMNDCI